MPNARPLRFAALGRSFPALCIAAVLAVGGCDCSDDGGGGGTGGGTGGTGGGTGGTGGGTGGTGGGTGGTGGGSGFPDGGGPEVCDGFDNDGNGRIDDIDVGGDGICDCLNVGIIGRPGKWGGSSALDAWLSVRGSLVEVIDDGVEEFPGVVVGDGNLVDANLSRFDVLIVNDVSNYDAKDYPPDSADDDLRRGIYRAYGPEEIAAFQAFVQNGGGVITMTGYWGDPEDLVNVNALLGPFGMSYAQAPYIGGLTDIDFWDASHPLANGITSAGVDNGHEPQGPGVEVAWEDGLNGSTVVGLAQAGTAEVGTGKVFVWGDEWIAYDQLWVGAQGAGYQIEQLWVNVMNWLTPADSCEIVIIPL